MVKIFFNNMVVITKLVLNLVHIKTYDFVLIIVYRILNKKHIILKVY